MSIYNKGKKQEEFAEKFAEPLVLLDWKSVVPVTVLSGSVRK